MTEKTEEKDGVAEVSEEGELAGEVMGLIIGASLLLILGSFLVPGYQGYMWLKTGEWTPMKTDVVFSEIMNDDYYEWLETDSWVGAKAVLKYITVNMSLFWFWLLAAIIIFYVIIAVPISHR